MKPRNRKATAKDGRAVKNAELLGALLKKSADTAAAASDIARVLKDECEGGAEPAAETLSKIASGLASRTYILIATAREVLDGEADDGDVREYLDGNVEVRL